MLSLDKQLRTSMRFSDREKSLRASIGADLSSLVTHLQKYNKLLTESDGWQSKQIRGFNRQLSAVLAQSTRLCAEFREFIKGAPDFCDKSAVSALSELTRVRQSQEQTQIRNRSLLAQVSSVEAAKLARFQQTQLATFDRLIGWAAISLQEFTKLRSTVAQLSQKLEVQEIEGRLAGLDLGDVVPFRPNASNLAPSSRKTQTAKAPQYSQRSPGSPPSQPQQNGGQLTQERAEIHSQQSTSIQLVDTRPCQTICLVDEAEDVQKCSVPVQYVTAKKFQLIDDERQTKDSDQQTEVQIDRDIDQMWQEYSALKNQLVQSGVL